MSMTNKSWGDLEDIGNKSELPDMSDIDVRVIVMFGAPRIKPLFVVVEMWDHKKYGQAKRKYQEQFTDAERKLLSRYYAKLYAWYLRTGIPINGVPMKVSTYDLLVRAANFFASL